MEERERRDAAESHRIDGRRLPDCPPIRLGRLADGEASPGVSPNQVLRGFAPSSVANAIAIAIPLAVFETVTWLPDLTRASR